MHHFDRRHFLQGSLGLLGGAAVWPSSAGLLGQTAPREKLPVAAVVSEYRKNSHADVIVGKVLEGWKQDGGPGPDLQLVALYTDQTPENDLGRPLSEKHGFRLAKTIDEALTLGSDKLAVAGVLSIGEHGKYPDTPDTGQTMYPRRRFFDEIIATYRRVGQTAPIFNDKHLAYAWADAKHMYDTAREMKIPFMAGSSLPVAWRAPSQTLPLDCELEEAMSLGYGPLEGYGFHATEVLQCLVERRKGGEVGVESVEVLQGQAIWNAAAAGRWSRELFDAAMARVPVYRAGKPEEILMADASWYLIKYRDGLKATVAMANGASADFGFAAKVKGQAEPFAIRFPTQEHDPFEHFAYLLRAIEHMFHTGQAAYPVERTLLTTGILDAAMHSLAEQGKPQLTAEFDVAYQPADWPFAPGFPD
ncbi:MAG: hypothetical protein AB7O62_03940 [Pirellulales bacterium]